MSLFGQLWRRPEPGRLGVDRDGIIADRRKLEGGTCG